MEKRSELPTEIIDAFDTKGVTGVNGTKDTLDFESTPTVHMTKLRVSRCFHFC
jgi:hypothetical protein